MSLEIEKQIVGISLKKPEQLLKYFFIIDDNQLIKDETCVYLIKVLYKFIEKDCALTFEALKLYLRNVAEKESKNAFVLLEELSGSNFENATIEICIDILINLQKRDSLKLIIEGLEEIYEKQIPVNESNLSSLHYQLKNVLYDESINNLYRKNKPKLEELVKNLTSEEISTNNIKTEFKSIDSEFDGFKEDELIIIGGRPGMGKTTLMLNCALNTALFGDVPTAFISLDHSVEKCYERMLSIIAEVPISKILNKSLSIVEKENVKKASKYLLSKNLTVNCPQRCDLSYLEYVITRLVLEQKSKLIFIDYLQLINLGDKFKGNRDNEVSTITRRLKLLTRQLNITIVCSSQLSRAVERRGINKPELSDLRDSGAIEQDADSVWFLYRPIYYGLTEDENGNNTVGLAEIVIAKNRMGKVGTACLYFDHEIPKFSDLEEGRNIASTKANLYNVLDIRKDEFDDSDAPFRV